MPLTDFFMPQLLCGPALCCVEACSNYLAALSPVQRRRHEVPSEGDGEPELLALL